MNTKDVLTLIAALAANGPAIGTDLAKLMGSLGDLINGTPNATSAEILAKINADLADAGATDKAVEQGAV